MTVPKFELADIPLARVSDASLTRPLRRAEEVSGKHITSRPKCLISAAPTPTPFDSILSELGIIYGRFSELRISPLISDCPALCVKLSPPFQSHNTNQLFLFRLSPLAATRGGVIELSLSSD